VTYTVTSGAGDIDIVTVTVYISCSDIVT